MSGDFIDTFGVPEHFCETLAKIEKVGPCRRLIFVIKRGGSTIPMASLVFPAEALTEIARQLVADAYDTHPEPPISRRPALAN
jgi:hypothetical protein